MAGKCVKHNIFYVEKCPCCGSGICFECGLQKDENGHNTRYTKRYYAKYRAIEDEARTILTVTSTAPDPGFTMNIQTYHSLEPTKTIQGDTVKCVDCGENIPKRVAHPVMLEYMDTLTRREWRCATCDGKKYGSTTENPHGRRLAMSRQTPRNEDERTSKYNDQNLTFLMSIDDHARRYANKVVSKLFHGADKPVETEKDMENWLGAALTHLGNIDKDYDVDVENFVHASEQMRGKGLIIGIDGVNFALYIRKEDM